MNSDIPTNFTIIRKNRPIFLRATKDDNGTIFLFDGHGNIPSHEIATAFLDAAQNTLRLSGEKITAFNDENFRLEKQEYERENPERLVRPASSRRTKLYLMRNVRNGYTKIGISDNPVFRERTLQSQEPEIDLIFSQDTDYRVEEMLHSHFADLRIRGEWFHLTEDHIAEIKEIITKLEASL